MRVPPRPSRDLERLPGRAFEVADAALGVGLLTQVRSAECVLVKYYCRNHPRPSEAQYPLWRGLREDSTMTTAGLRTRLQECTGFSSPPAERTALQQRNLDDILAVTGIPERTLESHLRFATFTFRGIVHNRLGGRNRFPKHRVQTFTDEHEHSGLSTSEYADSISASVGSETWKRLSGVSASADGGQRLPCL